MKAIRNIKNLAATLLIIALQACSSSELLGPDGNNPPTDRKTAVKFSSDAQIGTRTTAGGNEWLTNDSIGIYMMNFGDAIALSIAENRLYAAQTDGASQIAVEPVTHDQTIYYPDAATPLNFIAYYPWKPYGAGNIVNYTYPVDLSNQADTTHIDLLYGTYDGSYDQTGSGVTQSTTPIDLKFQHQLSKIIINVKAANPTDVIVPGMHATINSMQALADFNLAAGSLTAKGNPRAIEMLEIPITATGFETAFQAIILPHQIQSGGAELIQMNTIKRQFSWDISHSVLTDFDPGMQYTFNLTLVGESQVEFTAEIAPWTDGGSITATRPNSPSGTLSKMPIAGGLDTLNVVFIHPKEPFMMGSALTSSGNPNTPIHKVTLTKSFFMTEGEITNAEYALFLNSFGATVNANNTISMDVSRWIPGKTNVSVGIVTAPSAPTIGNFGLIPSGGKVTPNPGCENNPALGVSWYGALAYARWAGGTLPTEAQWEYAARGGMAAANNYINGTVNGTGGTALSTYAWYGKSGGAGNKPVGGTFTPNGYNLYHMTGNMLEWTLDRLATSSEGYDPLGVPVTDPVGSGDAGPISDLVSAIMRGGAYNSPIGDSYIGVRFALTINSVNSHQGFRVIFPLQ